jgi:hypothetical protein
MTDVFLDSEIQVRKNVAIQIGVRFTVGDEFFCTTYLGYNNEDVDSRVKTNEKGAFKVENSIDMCTKGETDRTFGQIPRIHYS